MRIFPVLTALLCTLCFSIEIPSAQQVLYPGHLVYEGAFRVPQNPSGGTRFGYGGTAPVFHPMRQSLYLVGHDWDQEVAEISIPELIISDNLGDLHVASYLQTFEDPSEGLMYTVDNGTVKVGGLLIHDDKLIGSAYSYYDADGSQYFSHWTSDTVIGVSGDADGMFRVGDVGAGYVSGYMTTIPEFWQDSLGGNAITGQCCIPIISRTSYGPAAFAISANDFQTEDSIGAITLVYYTASNPLDEWDATSPYFNGTTEVTGIVIPENSRTVLFFGNHGIGEFCYGTGEACDDPVNGSQGTHAYPYVYQVWAYDIYDLIDVRRGNAAPWEVYPYAVWHLEFPIGQENRRIGGATYDAENNRIYVTQLRVDGLDALPLVHAFSVRGPHIYVDSSSTGSSNGVSWATAFPKLRDALAIAHPGDTIHIAQGTYYPDEGGGAINNDPDASFAVDTGVVVLGGYASGGSAFDPELYSAILSGDLEQNDVTSPALSPEDIIGLNAHSVMVCSGGLLEHLTITAGHAGVGSEPGMPGNSGAGLFIEGEVRIRSCRITGNLASGTDESGRGGGVYLASGELYLDNVFFVGNSASDAGDAIYTTTGSVVFQSNVQLQNQ